VDPRASLDDVEKRKFLTLPGLELRPLSCPACSQSLSWLLDRMGETRNTYRVSISCVKSQTWYCNTGECFYYSMGSESRKKYVFMFALVEHCISGCQEEICQHTAKRHAVIGLKCVIICRTS
jgi:hypothetical protein